ncbi:hypothetical protein [Oceanidesulfovibrio marinus]|uniref:Uncharacterized protein n=1 Tax=Oceanidesulfovibrio marinus TaxID=370038 RepID=A0ABX6NJ27_9BACT|nr:hypothetical protein [Oceanidesulfovibrio marinus]QJT10635.1 hypothetical protein E8L03_17690 [Oceanidesulfovibrio marinus]
MSEGVETAVLADWIPCSRPGFFWHENRSVGGDDWSQDLHRAEGKISLSIIQVTRIEELGNATSLKIFIIDDACGFGQRRIKG